MKPSPSARCALARPSALPRTTFEALRLTRRAVRLRGNRRACRGTPARVAPLHADEQLAAGCASAAARAAWRASSAARRAYGLALVHHFESYLVANSLFEGSTGARAFESKTQEHNARNKLQNRKFEMNDTAVGVAPMSSGDEGSISPTIVAREMTLLFVSLLISAMFVVAYIFLIDRPRARSGACLCARFNCTIRQRWNRLIRFFGDISLAACCFVFCEIRFLLLVVGLLCWSR